MLEELSEEEVTSLTEKQLHLVQMTYTGTIAHQTAGIVTVVHGEGVADFMQRDLGHPLIILVQGRIGSVFLMPEPSDRNHRHSTSYLRLAVYVSENRNAEIHVGESHNPAMSGVRQLDQVLQNEARIELLAVVLKSTRRHFMRLQNVHRDCEVGLKVSGNDMHGKVSQSSHGNDRHGERCFLGVLHARARP